MTIEELEAQLKAEREKVNILEGSKARLLEETKGFKERAQKAETAISQKETEQLEAKGELQKLLDKQREENKTLSETLNNRTSSVLREKLRNEVAKFAKDAHDVDMLLKITEHKDVLKIDEDALSIEGAEDFVAKARETHKFMFSKKILDDTENRKPKGEDGKTDDEKYYEALSLATTRKELAAVRLKYGKN